MGEQKKGQSSIGGVWLSRQTSDVARQLGHPSRFCLTRQRWWRWCWWRWWRWWRRWWWWWGWWWRWWPGSWTSQSVLSHNEKEENVDIEDNIEDNDLSSLIYLCLLCYNTKLCRVCIVSARSNVSDDVHLTWRLQPDMDPSPQRPPHHYHQPACCNQQRQHRCHHHHHHHHLPLTDAVCLNAGLERNFSLPRARPHPARSSLDPTSTRPEQNILQPFYLGVE